MTLGLGLEAQVLGLAAQSLALPPKALVLHLMALLTSLQSGFYTESAVHNLSFSI